MLDIVLFSSCLAHWSMQRTITIITTIIIEISKPILQSYFSQGAKLHPSNKLSSHDGSFIVIWLDFATVDE